MKWAFGVVQWNFKFAWPDDVDAQISYLNNPRQILIIYGNVTTFIIVTWTNTHCARFLHVDSHVSHFFQILLSSFSQKYLYLPTLTQEITVFHEEFSKSFYTQL